MIRQYFTVKEDDRKPCFGQVATLSTNEAAILNESVEKAPEAKGKRGKYNRYSPEDRANIGTHAVENGASKAARHYSKIMGVVINDSTVRSRVLGC